MGRLAIVEEDDVSNETSTVLPPTKKYRSNDNCYTGLKCNQKSRQYIQEAQGKSPKKHQTYKKTSQRHRIQNQTSRKTKGISDESGYFEEEVDEEGNDGQGTSQPIGYFSSPLIRENSPKSCHPQPYLNTTTTTLSPFDIGVHFIYKYEMQHHSNQS